MRLTNKLHKSCPLHSLRVENSNDEGGKVGGGGNFMQLRKLLISMLGIVWVPITMEGSFPFLLNRIHCKNYNVKETSIHLRAPSPKNSTNRGISGVIESQT